MWKVPAGVRKALGKDRHREWCGRGWYYHLCYHGDVCLTYSNFMSTSCQREANAGQIVMLANTTKEVSINIKMP